MDPLPWQNETPFTGKTLRDGLFANDEALKAEVETFVGGGLSESDIDTLSKINAIITDATLIDTADSRLSDSRTPTAHNHDALALTNAPAEAGATADQTGAEIKVAYEAEADTNAYTDAEKAKMVNVPADTNTAIGLKRNSADNVPASEVDVENSLIVIDAPDDLQTIITQIDSSLANSASTGVRSGGRITINVGDPSTVDVSACAGRIVDNTDPADVQYYSIGFVGATAVALDNTATPITYWYLDNTGALQQSVTALSNDQMRQNIFLGRTSFSGGVVIAATADLAPVQQGVEQLRDLASFLGELKSGYLPTNASTDLTVKIGAGASFAFGRNFHNSATNPHVVSHPETDPTTFQHATQNGGSGSNITVLDVGNYDVAGVVTAIPGGSGRATVMPVYKFSGNGAVRIQYGNEWYASLTAAQEAVDSNSISHTLPPVYENAIRLGFIAVEKGATDLSDPSEVIFTSTNIFGEIGGGISGLSGAFLKIANNLSDILDASAARSNLGLEIGADVQAYDGTISNLKQKALVFQVFDSPITDGLVQAVAIAQTDGIFTDWSIGGDELESGSATVSLMTKNGSDIIGAGVNPSVSSSTSNTGSNMTDITTAFSRGDKFKITLSATSTFTWLQFKFNYDLT